MSATPSRNRLLPIVGLVLVVGFLTTNVLSYLISANALRTAIIEHELPLTGNNVLAEVEKDLVRPILVLLTFPLTVVTLGLFLLVVNAATIGIVAVLLGGFVVDGLWAGIGAAIITGVVSWIAGAFIGDGKRRE